MNVLELGRAAALTGCTLQPSRRGTRADGKPRKTYNAAPLNAASWFAGMVHARREARAAATRKTAAARLLEELYDHATAMHDLRDTRARVVIGAELGGRHPESVRRAALAAMRLGELYVAECQGDSARSDGRPWHGRPTNVYVLTRALALIPRMPAAVRAAHLADPVIREAIAWVKRQAAGGRAEAPPAHEDRALAAPAPSPVLEAPPAVLEAPAAAAEAVALEALAGPKPNNLAGTRRVSVSEISTVTDSFPFFPPLRASGDDPPPLAGGGAAQSSSGPEGGPPAAAWSETGVTAGASSVPGLEPPAPSPGASPSSPSAAGADAASQAHDDEGSSDPPASSAERRARRELAGELVPYLLELERIAVAPRLTPYRPRPWQPDDQARARAELETRAERERVAALEADAERWRLARTRIERARELDRRRVDQVAEHNARAAAAARRRELLEALPRLLEPGELLELRDELEAAAAAAGCELPPLELRGLLALYPDAAASWLEVVASRLRGVS